MRKIMVEVEVSVDGAMGGDNADFWQQVFSYHSPDVVAYLNTLLFTPDALLLGKRTYESFATVWPTRQGEDAERINNMPKYVASRTLNEPLTWKATLIKGDVVDALKKLKQESGKGLLQYGVGELTHAMLQHGLVDEVRILVYPFTFGEGPRIFEHMGIHPMKLLDTQTFHSGAVAHRYQLQAPA